MLPGLLLLAVRDEKPAALLFIRRECPIAAKYAPEMNRVFKKFGDRVRFSLVHVDPDATPELARRFGREFRLSLPTLPDPKATQARRYGVTTVPTAVVLDASGKVCYFGRIDDRFPKLGAQRAKPRRADLRIALEEVLAGKPVRLSRTPVVGCLIP